MSTKENKDEDRQKVVAKSKSEEGHVAAWLGLCPDNRISGDKVLARGILDSPWLYNAVKTKL